MRRSMVLVAVLVLVAPIFAKQMKPWDDMSFTEIEDTMESAFKIQGWEVEVELNVDKQGVYFHIDTGGMLMVYSEPKNHRKTIKFLFEACAAVGEITRQTSWKSSRVYFLVWGEKQAWVSTWACRKFLNLLKQGDSTKAGNFLVENYHTTRE